MNPLVSVIVPAYKVEDRLVRCLDSLRRQSMKEIEVVLVDDASPDHCGEICEAYARKDVRFKVIHHKENRGLSVARNTGIKAATAVYLMFLDGDDEVHTDFCKAAYDCAVQNHSDLVMFRHKEVKYNCIANIGDKSISGFASGNISKEEALDLMQGAIGQVAWNKLYHKNLFSDISFPQGFLYEDWGTTYKTVLKAKRIYYLDKVLYYHYQRPGSIITFRNEKAVRDRYMLMMQQYSALKNWGGYPAEKLDALLQTIAMDYCIKRKRDVTDQDYVFCAGILRACNAIPAHFNCSRKVLFLLFKHCFPLFEMSCLMWNKKYT